jgi:hypothetical protein
MLNFQFQEVGESRNSTMHFGSVGLKGGENSSEQHESWHGRLFTNGTSKSILKFQFQEVGQS